MPLGERLPRTAIQVVLASRRLPAGIKLVWELDFYLDQGPEGAWISGSNLATRLGMTKETVEKYRRVLSRLGLHESRPRPGGRTMSWYATLPAQCVPPIDMSIEAAIALGSVLDQHIDEHEHTGPASGIRATSIPDRSTASTPEYAVLESGGKPDSSPPQTRTPVHPLYREGVEGEGREREGGSLSNSVFKTPSVSPVNRAREGSLEPIEREVAAKLADMKARWDAKQVRR